MAAYNFPAWQAPLVEAGTKHYTVRKPQKLPGGHSKPGETMRLWVGQRTKAARLLGTPLCIGVDPVRFRFYSDPRATAFEVAGVAADPEAFARLDGFEGLAHMRAFWFQQHAARGADRLDFVGVKLSWVPLQP